jgi:hypothetical protein
MGHRHDPHATELARLSEAQRVALRHVDEMARRRQAGARDRLTAISHGGGCAGGMLDAAIESIRTHARVVLHFHPDRLGTKGTTVVEALLQEVPDDFRGPAMPRLARRIAGDGVLDAAVIGAAEASLCSRPESWRDWGSYEETLQHLKQLWHVLVHYGAPARRT